MTNFQLTSPDFLNFDLDHVELHGTFKNHYELFLGLDGDNSCFREHEGYTFEKTDKLRNFQYKISIRRGNRTLFAWYKGEQLNEYIETRDYFVVYGSNQAIRRYGIQGKCIPGRKYPRDAKEPLGADGKTDPNT